MDRDGPHEARLEVSFRGGRQHLPIVSLRRAAPRNEGYAVDLVRLGRRAITGVQPTLCGRHMVPITRPTLQIDGFGRREKSVA